MHNNRIIKMKKLLIIAVLTTTIATTIDAKVTLRYEKLSDAVTLGHGLSLAVTRNTLFQINNTTHVNLYQNTATGQVHASWFIKTESDDSQFAKDEPVKTNSQDLIDPDYNYEGRILISQDGKIEIDDLIKGELSYRGETKAAGNFVNNNAKRAFNWIYNQLPSSNK